MQKFFIFTLFVLLNLNGSAQLVEVQADYNAVGDCIFSAHNNAPTPIFLNIDFADLENTTFSETLPYVKKLTPGFNSLFTLPRDLDADVPRFNYQMKSYRSNPMADVDLDFPYLIPFAPGSKVLAVGVDNINGFWGASEPKSWQATGFETNPGTPVYAVRRGEIVEIMGATRSGDSKYWYNTWPNSITVLQADGTLVCYKNVVDKSKKWKVNDTVFPGEILGEVATNSNKIILLIYQNKLGSDDLMFIIPQFVIEPGKLQIVISGTSIEVSHPLEVRGLEMTKKERKKNLNSK